MDENRITYFAVTDSRNKRDEFGIKAKDRSKHVYVIGKTGMGKSTMLENMVVQDIKNGEGVAFIDPHGASAEKILDYIPEERIDDVLYFAPFDMEFPVAFNVMEDVGYDKRHLVVSGLMSAFEKIWADQWSSRMEYILSNTLLALLEYPDSTMLGVNKMYVDKAFRKKVVDNVKDPLVKAFWEGEYATYTDRYTQEATPAIQNKIGQFTGNPLIRNIIGQSKSTFDLRKLMDDKKIIIANLSKGRVGETNADLLGSMFITKIYLAAMSRADVPETTLNQLPDFYFYVDEFQSFANESFTNILSEARKYKLNLTMAHQYIEQMTEEVRAAVFGNVGTMITFRVGAYDADILEKEFAPTFYAQDLVNLGFTQIYLKLMIDGVASQPFSATTLPPIVPPEISYKQQALESSRKKYGRPRRQIEEAIAKEYAMPKPQQKTERQPQRPQKPRERENVSGKPLDSNVSPRFESEERQVPSQEASQKKRNPIMEPSPHREQLGRIGEQMKKGDDESTRQEKHQKKEVKQKQDGKGPTEKSRAELRNALAGVLKNETARERKQVPKSKESKPRGDDFVESKKAPSTEPKEIPEDKLRKMLEVEE